MWPEIERFQTHEGKQNLPFSYLEEKENLNFLLFHPYLETNVNAVCSSTRCKTCFLSRDLLDSKMLCLCRIINCKGFGHRDGQTEFSVHLLTLMSNYIDKNTKLTRKLGELIITL